LTMVFRPNRKFRQHYNWLFKKNPLGANLFLLLAELANEGGQVRTSPEELAELMAIRFGDDPRRYSL
jgi:hypothetical protein